MSTTHPAPPFLSDPLETFASPRLAHPLAHLPAAILLALTLIVAAAGFSLAIVCNPLVALTVVERTHPDADALQRKALITIAGPTLRYVTELPFEQGSTPDISDTALATLGRTTYSSDELSHLRDVRTTIGWTLSVALVLGILDVLLLTVFRVRRAMRVGTLAGGIVCLLLPAIAAIALGLFFDPTFELFHQLLYPQGNWQFASDSLLISTFPEQYWLTMGLLWMAVFAFCGVLCVVISRFCGKDGGQYVTNASVYASIGEAKNQYEHARD